LRYFFTLQYHANAQSEYRNNRYPLVEKPFVELPIGAVKADG
jgi:hypothetical protein